MLPSHRLPGDWKLFQSYPYQEMKKLTSSPWALSGVWVDVGCYSLWNMNARHSLTFWGEASRAVECFVLTFFVWGGN
jgi:hypothetical protein